MRDFVKDREICNADRAARSRINELYESSNEAIANDQYDRAQADLREMSKSFDVIGEFVEEARIGWLAALDRIAELEAENARLKEQLERWNAAKSSMNTTLSLPPTTGANSSS